MNLWNKGFAFFILFLIVLVGQSYAQEQFRVAFYNVENLYDTINNPHTQDDDFTPDGNLRWNSYRYFNKLDAIGKAISSVGGKYPPAIVGLCEVENESVIKDLLSFSLLSKHKYHHRITKSKDGRGSNIAFLYQRDQFKLLQKRSYRPSLSNGKRTRDILYIMGEVVSGDTLNVFICHFPSRSEGVSQSAPLRKSVSAFLKKKIHEVQRKQQDAQIIIMGDFNDYPDDDSMKQILGATPLADANVISHQLYNLSYKADDVTAAEGSYKFQGKWGFLDQLIVSGSLLDTNRNTHVLPDSFTAYSDNNLLDYDEKYEKKKPFRTYSGWTYLGGASDHLPIYIDLYIKE